MLQQNLLQTFLYYHPEHKLQRMILRLSLNQILNQLLSRINFFIGFSINDIIGIFPVGTHLKFISVKFTKKSFVNAPRFLVNRHVHYLQSLCQVLSSHQLIQSFLFAERFIKDALSNINSSGETA